MVPLSTSVAQSGRGPLLPQGAAGLSKDSVALCHQVTTLDRAKLTQRIGELNSTELSQVEDGIKAAGLAVALNPADSECKIQRRNAP
jgi:mRNA-degrading endonuclease toxin of MazEF toxin-antitoxin module